MDIEAIDCSMNPVSPMSTLSKNGEHLMDVTHNYEQMSHEMSESQVSSPEEIEEELYEAANSQDLEADSQDHSEVAMDTRMEEAAEYAHPVDGKTVTRLEMAASSNRNGSAPSSMHDPNDVTRFDLELVENHMRHVGTNAGPFYADSGPVILGRDIFKLHDRHRVRGLISRNHCRIEAFENEDGELEYYVKDMSVNGTFLGPKRLDPDGPGALVQHGDVIGLLTSHSGPIETYSPEGEYFKVTMGVRFLRPNLEIAHEIAGTELDAHAPITSPLGAVYGPGTFAGAFPNTAIVVSPQNPHELLHQHHNSSHTPSSWSVPSSGRHSPSIDSVATDIATPSSYVTPKRRSLLHTTSKKNRSKIGTESNHSGNDTDDTDGDDERDAIAHPTPNRHRKPIVTVSTPEYEEDPHMNTMSDTISNASTMTKKSTESSRPSSRKTKPSTHPASKSSTTQDQYNRNKGKRSKSVTNPHMQSDKTTEAEHGLEFSELHAPESYWLTQPDTSKRKRSRSFVSGSDDDLIADVPARKLWAH